MLLMTSSLLSFVKTLCLYFKSNIAFHRRKERQDSTSHLFHYSVTHSLSPTTYLNSSIQKLKSLIAGFQPSGKWRSEKAISANLNFKLRTYFHFKYKSQCYTLFYLPSLSFFSLFLVSLPSVDLKV